MNSLSLTKGLIAMSILFVACEGANGTDGRDGVDGSEGPAGQNGVDGQNGTDGKDGADGKDGIDGQDGADGQNGVDGINGQDGVDGINGQDGTDGTNGIDGINGQDGRDGVDGIDGQDGADGHDGKDGHNGSTGPWGVNLSILSVEGGSGSAGQLEPGDYPIVTFSVEDDDGVEYDLADLSNVYFNVTGPTTHPQIVIYYNQITNVRTTSVDNYDGTYTYTFSTPIPSTFHAVPNDTTALDEDWGDWGGLSMSSDIDGDGINEIDGTYFVGGVAYLTVTDTDGTTYPDADNDIAHVLFGSATTETTRNVVVEENCQGCHGDAGFRMHGGSRQKLELCLTCHVDGAEDRYSATDSTVTPGISVGMTEMIHKVHMGAELTNGYIVAGYGGSASYALNDFGEVEFPSFPGGPADCAQCHEGGDGTNYTEPTRQACGACHDSIVWAAGTNHTGGKQTSDANCTLCHYDGGMGGGPEEVHMDPRDTTATWTAAGHAAGKTGVNVTVLSVTDQTGSTTLDIGDTLTVKFSVLYDDGTPIPQSFFKYSSTSSTCPTVAGSGTVILAGPSDHMQRVMYSASAGSSTIVGSVYGSSTVDTATGIWTYTLAATAGSATGTAIPATYPLQSGDSSTTLIGVPFGDLYGQAFEAGTYRVHVDMYTAMWDDTTCATGATRYRDTDTAYMDVTIGSGVTLDPHDVIDEGTCEECHNKLEFHGGSRIEASYCIACHTPGMMGGYTEDGDYATLDFKSMIHKIHYSDSLDKGFKIGSTGTPFDVTFPRFDGGVAACDACHGTNESYKDPQAAACTTCHDSDDALAHAALNTDATYGESCDVCHGEGSEFAVETVHAYYK